MVHEVLVVLLFARHIPRFSDFFMKIITNAYPEAAAARDASLLRWFPRIPGSPPGPPGSGLHFWSLLCYACLDKYTLREVVNFLELYYSTINVIVGRQIGETPRMKT
jgi:hypothetical protein